MELATVHRPKDWPAESLGAILSRISNGLVYQAGKTDQFPVTRIETIADGSVNMARTGRAKATRDIENYRLQPGDVLFSHINSLEHIGKVAIYRGGPALYHGMNLLLLRCGDRLNPSYLYFWLSSLPGRRTSALLARQAVSQASINTTDLRNVVMPLPPRSEQDAIVAALSDVTLFIESLVQLMVKKRAIKRGSMQALLTGKTRLPGFGVTPRFKDSEVGPIAEDWNVVRLGTMLRNAPSYGINAAAVPFGATAATYLRITDITDDGRFDQSTKASVDHPLSADYVLQDGDLVFARTGASVGKSYLYNFNDGRLVFAGFLIRVSPAKDVLLPEYLSQYVRTQPYWNWVKQNSMRSGQPGINGQEYASLPIPLPPTRNEQQAIAAALADMDAELIQIEQEHKKARDLKQGMMQQLLIGRVRLV